MPPSAPKAAVDRSTRSSTARIGRVLILVGFLILVLWASLKAWRVYQAASTLMTLEPEARALVAGGLANIDPDATEALVLTARREIATLSRELSFVKPIAPLLGWVPRLGPTLVASPYLLEMADAGSEAGAIAVSSLKPALAIVQSEDFSGSRLGELLPVLSDAAPDLELAEDALARYVSARDALGDTVPVESLPWRITQMLQLSDQWLPVAEDGLRLLPALPALLGQDGPRRYLILAQNEDEMRATGGYITGAGAITVQDGQIIDLRFRDSTFVDNWLKKPYAAPPQPLFDIMRLEMFGFRDSNFWPDFRVSAQKAMDLYSYGMNEPPFDGAIAIDQEFLRLLVDATGPVPIPDLNQTINASNLIETLRQARDIQEGQEVWQWVNNRKAFLGGFAAAIQAKVENDFTSINPVKLASNLTSAAEGRHMTIFVRDPELAAILAENGWDGSMPIAPPGDVLMVVDSNMGYNKANIFIEREIDYAITLADAPEARLTLTYRHSGPASDEPCFQGVDQEFEEAAEYLAIADQCYWNYLRVYTPLGSELVDSSRHVVPGESYFSESGWDSNARQIEDLPWLTTFANFMLLPRAEELTSFFHYQLPAGVIVEADEGGNVYQLRLMKQPGTRSEKVRVTVALPEGMTARSVNPSTATINGNEITIEGELDSNLTIEIRYR